MIGKIRHLYMALSHTLILHLHHVRNLSHPLNLGGYFLREFNTRLCFAITDTTGPLNHRTCSNYGKTWGCWTTHF